MEGVKRPGMRREERLNCWVASYSDAILRTCFLYLSDHAQAEDALQDTFIKAWRSMGEYERKGVGNDKAWLMRIAINTCKDYRRTAWFRYIDSRQALEELPDKLKQVVLLYYFQGLTQRETAQALGLSQAAVVRRLRAAESRLRQLLTGGEDDEA